MDAFLIATLLSFHEKLRIGPKVALEYAKVSLESIHQIRDRLRYYNTVHKLPVCDVDWDREDKTYDKRLLFWETTYKWITSGPSDEECSKVIIDFFIADHGRRVQPTDARTADEFAAKRGSSKDWTKVLLLTLILIKTAITMLKKPASLQLQLKTMTWEALEVADILSYYPKLPEAAISFCQRRLVPMCKIQTVADLLSPQDLVVMFNHLETWSVMSLLRTHHPTVTLFQVEVLTAASLLRMPDLLPTPLHHQATAAANFIRTDK